MSRNLSHVWKFVSSPLVHCLYFSYRFLLLPSSSSSSPLLITPIRFFLLPSVDWWLPEESSLTVIVRHDSAAATMSDIFILEKRPKLHSFLIIRFFRYRAEVFPRYCVKIVIGWVSASINNFVKFWGDAGDARLSDLCLKENKLLRIDCECRRVSSHACGCFLDLFLPLFSGVSIIR